MKLILAGCCFLMLFLISFFIPGCCEKDEEDAAKQREIVCSEIRAGLTGDMVYTTRNNLVMKTTFHPAGCPMETKLYILV